MTTPFGDHLNCLIRKNGKNNISEYIFLFFIETKRPALLFLDKV